jgi:hypothetical protein
MKYLVVTEGTGKLLLHFQRYVRVPGETDTEHSAWRPDEHYVTHEVFAFDDSHADHKGYLRRLVDGGTVRIAHDRDWQVWKKTLRDKHLAVPVEVLKHAPDEAPKVAKPGDKPEPGDLIEDNDEGDPLEAAAASGAQAFKDGFTHKDCPAYEKDTKTPEDKKAAVLLAKTWHDAFEAAKKAGPAKT